MNDARDTEPPSGRNTTADPIAALRREELKYAHLSRRDTPAIRENRRQLADHIASNDDSNAKSRKNTL